MLCYLLQFQYLLQEYLATKYYVVLITTGGCRDDLKVIHGGEYKMDVDIGFRVKPLIKNRIIIFLVKPLNKSFYTAWRNVMPSVLK